MTSRESRWTEEDFAEQLALVEYRATLCECCGLPKTDVQGHEADSPNFVVTSRYCHARRTLAEAQAAFLKQYKEPQPRHNALLWSVRIEKR